MTPTPQVLIRGRERLERARAPATVPPTPRELALRRAAVCPRGIDATCRAGDRCPCDPEGLV